MRSIKLLVLTMVFCGALALAAHAQSTAITTTEAQSVVDALGQSQKHWWSVYMLGMAQVAAALATLSLLLKMRTLAFLFLIFYGTLILGVPYYIPTIFQSVFGIAITLMAFVGLMMRLMLMQKKAPPAPKEDEATPKNT